MRPASLDQIMCACPMFSNKMRDALIRTGECVRSFMGADFYTFSVRSSIAALAVLFYLVCARGNIAQGYVRFMRVSECQYLGQSRLAIV